MIVRRLLVESSYFRVVPDQVITWKEFLMWYFHIAFSKSNANQTMSIDQNLLLWCGSNFLGRGWNFLGCSFYNQVAWFQFKLLFYNCLLRYPWKSFKRAAYKTMISKIWFWQCALNIIWILNVCLEFLCILLEFELSLCDVVWSSWWSKMDLWILHVTS